MEALSKAAFPTYLGTWPFLFVPVVIVPLYWSGVVTLVLTFPDLPFDSSFFLLLSFQNIILKVIFLKIVVLLCLRTSDGSRSLSHPLPQHRYWRATDLELINFCFTSCIYKWDSYEFLCPPILFFLLVQASTAFLHLSTCKSSAQATKAFLWTAQMDVGYTWTHITLDIHWVMITFVFIYN